MRIIAIVYRLGGHFPTGVTNKRVLDALRSLGHEVFVISAPTDVNTWHDIYHHECSDFPTSPARLLTRLGNFIQRDLNFYFWEKRVFRYALKVIDVFHPDLIYGRSSPSAACSVTARIARKKGLPSLLHFTDPIPAPPEWASNARYRNREIKLMRQLLLDADKVSFGNSAMLKYEQSLIDYDFSAKSFISPDPSPSNSFYYTNQEPHEGIILSFLGSFHGNRNPNNLFDAIRRLNTKGYHIHLNIYDINRSRALYPEFVTFKGRTSNIQEALLGSDILVDVDGDDKIPVFISSKLKDYLCCGRPILSITSTLSPSYELTRGLKTIIHSSYSVDEIEIAIERLLVLRFTEQDYTERLPIIEGFNPQSIAKGIIEEITK